MPSNNFPIVIDGAPVTAREWFNPIAEAVTAIQAALPQAKPALVYKTADESVTSSITLQDDDHLVLPITAGLIYRMEFFGGAVGDQTGDIKIAFTYPSGTTMKWGSFGSNWTDAANPATLLETAYNKADTGTLSSSVFFGLSAGNPRTIRAQGLVIATVTGNLRLQWAQVSSVGTATTLQEGSQLSLDTIA